MEKLGSGGGGEPTTQQPGTSAVFLGTGERSLVRVGGAWR